VEEKAVALKAARHRKTFELSFHQSITTQYVLGLGLIAILVAASYVMLLELMRTHATWAAIINLSGRQRMLSQRISKQAHDLVMRTHEDSSVIRREILVGAARMERAHHDIINGNPQQQLRITLSESAREILFYPPLELDKKVMRYVEAVKNFAMAPDVEITPQNPYFKVIEEYSEDTLLAALDALVAEFQTEAERNAAALESRVTAIMSVLLLTILVEGVLLFRPLAWRIQQSADELAESQKKLAGITSSLGEGVLVTDQAGMITFVNPMALELTGYREDELLGKSVMDLKMRNMDGTLMPREERVIMQALMASPDTQHEGRGELFVRTREMILERKGGEQIMVEANATRLREKDQIVGAVASIKDITMRKTMDAILSAKSDLVLLLQEVAFAVNDVDTVDEAMRVCLSIVCKHTIWEIGHVYQPTEEGLMVPTDLWHSKEEGKFEEFRKATELMTFSPGRGLPGRVYLGKRPAWISDVRKDPNFPRAALDRKAEVRAGFAFPVLEGDKVVAVLEFFSSQAMEQDESVMNMANYLATQLGRVTERKRDMEAIKLAKEKAEDATRLKDKFISLVAHDMRAPLSTIIGLVKSVKTDTGHPISASQQDILSKTIIGGENMLELIDNLLDLEKLQSGQMRVEKLPLDARALAEEVIESLSYEASAKEIILKNEVERGVKISADYELIIEVIKNLAHNSIKFCSAGDAVSIFSPNSDGPAIGVRDNGPGIRKEIVEDIFRHDIKTSTIGTAGERGTGLGLPLCHDIIKAHGGEMEVVSELGKGATFLVKLPVDVAKE